jgi:mRNA-degrading endonuclease toxin of MazEF toxin-antitoxin module
MTLARGAIIENALDEHRGVIVQVDEAHFGTVLVVPFTDAKKWGGPMRWVHDCERKRNPGLTKNSVAVVPWVEMVSRKTLAKRRVLGTLHQDDLDQVGAKLRMIFGI